MKIILNIIPRLQSTIHQGLTLLFLSVIAPYSCLSQTQNLESDSVQYDNLRAAAFYKCKAIKFVAAPALLTSYGLLTIGNKDLFISSQDVYEFRQQNFSNFHSTIDNYMPSVPIAAVYLLNLVRVKGKNNFINRTILIAIATPISDKITHMLKSSTAIARPDRSDFESFPSAHTAAAFVAAEFLHQEFKDKSMWYSIAGYTTASMVGAFRILNNKHWMSDVFVGAAIGMLTVKSLYVVYPWLLGKLKRNKKENAVTIMPSFNGSAKGLTMIYKL